MVDKQINELTVILKSEDLKQYLGDAFFDLIQAVIGKDPLSTVSAAKNIKNLVFHMPTVLFWGKMKRFLYGTYRSYGDQIKMASKFDKCQVDGYEQYASFVKKQVYLINEIDEDEKIDYFASLTRCFLLHDDMDEALYFRLAKFLVLCTSYELDFMKKSENDSEIENSAITSLLYQYGLFEQNVGDIENGGIYRISSFGNALKECSLNFDDKEQSPGAITLSDLAPLELPSKYFFEEGEDIIE